MYQGKNPTALQSQNLITEALLALMEEEPFQKITIKAVCAHAGVSRQTFYSLFENKEEVIGRRLDQLFEEYRKRFIEESALTPFAVYVILLWSVLWSRKNSSVFWSKIIWIHWLAKNRKRIFCIWTIFSTLMTTKIVITPFHFLPARSSVW